MHWVNRNSDFPIPRGSHACGKICWLIVRKLSIFAPNDLELQMLRALPLDKSYRVSSLSSSTSLPLLSIMPFDDNYVYVQSNILFGWFILPLCAHRILFTMTIKLTVLYWLTEYENSIKSKYLNMPSFLSNFFWILLSGSINFLMVPIPAIYEKQENKSSQELQNT